MDFFFGFWECIPSCWAEDDRWNFWVLREVVEKVHSQQFLYFVGGDMDKCEPCLIFR